MEIHTQIFLQETQKILFYFMEIYTHISIYDM